jgi:hypothetical protein
VGPHVGRNSRAVIGNFNHDAVVVAIGSDLNLAFATHSVNRVVDEVRPYLIELAAEGIDEQGNFLVIAFDDDSVLEFVIQNR